MTRGPMFDPFGLDCFLGHRHTGSARQPLPSEKTVQGEVKQLLKMLHVAVYDTSQPHRAKITPGVPDLICFSERHGLFFVEVKRPGGRATRPQRLFQTLCEKAGVPYLLGGVAEVAAFLGLERAGGAWMRHER